MNKVDWSRPIRTNDLRLPAEAVGEFQFQGKLYKVVLVDNEHLWNVDAGTGRTMHAPVSAPPEIINVPERVWMNIYEGEAWSIKVKVACVCDIPVGHCANDECPHFHWHDADKCVNMEAPADCPYPDSHCDEV